jgi:hypothetical protein
MSKRTLSNLAIFAAVLSLVGCGRGGYEELAAPNQDNVDLVQAAFSSDSDSGGPKANPLEGRTEEAWASLEVVSRFEGPKPTPQQLRITRDNSTCQPGGRPVYGNLIQIGDDGSLGNVLLYLNTDLPVDDSDEEQPIWVHSRYGIQGNPDLATLEFDQKECLFLSPVFAMRSNQTLLVLNSDPVGHNTKLNTVKAKPFNSSIAANDSAEYVPGAQERQPIQVACNIHPWMMAFMIPRDNPYFGVSEVANRGEFTIADIPAGVELEYRLWVADRFVDSGSATLKFDGSTVEIKRGGKLKLTLTPGQTHKLELTVNSSAFGG